MKTYEIPNWTKLQEIPQSSIDAFRDAVTPEIIDMWVKYGIGHNSDGFFQTVDPMEWVDLVKESVFTHIEGKMVPLLRNCFGDILVRQGEYTRLLNYRHMYVSTLSSDLNKIFFLMNRKKILSLRESDEIAEQAKERLGPLPYGSIYGYNLILALGGIESADELRIVNARAHLEVICDLAGPISRSFQQYERDLQAVHDGADGH